MTNILRQTITSFFNLGATCTISDDLGVIAEGVRDTDTALGMVTDCDGVTTMTFNNNQHVTISKMGNDVRISGGLNSLER